MGTEGAWDFDDQGAVLSLAQGLDLAADAVGHGLGQDYDADVGLGGGLVERGGGLCGERGGFPGDTGQLEATHRVFIRDAVVFHWQAPASDLLQEHDGDGEAEYGQSFRQGHKKDAPGEQFGFFCGGAHGG